MTPILLTNKVVRFWLSPEGKTALKGIIDRDGFTAFVYSADDLGAWILPPTKRGTGFTSGKSLLLLKWDYFATAHLELDEPEGAERIQ
ncbi:MAG: hypothetical protein ABR866_20560 [Candidatus Korobacteraceae bacterium]|jgi:hypothetical protein